MKENVTGPRSDAAPEPSDASRAAPRPRSSPRRDVDPAILDVALELLERGETPSFEQLLARFPARRDDVRAALDALDAYRRRLTDSRRTREAGPMGDLAPGTVLGDFTIEGVLGRGAMGVVYRARQASLGGREVALKVLPSELVARDPRFLERFRREARLASMIHAPNAAEVYDFGAADGQVFFAMRLVEGPSLADVLEDLSRRRLRGEAEHTHLGFVRRVVMVVRDVARALGAVHAAGLVHRDVKPSNVLLDRSGRAQAAQLPADALAGVPTLVDFGLLRPVESSELTGSLTMLGTPAFAAPEARLGRAVDARADVFSLGVVLHDLVTLTRPRDRTGAATDLASVRALNPAVDARLAAVVTKALEERPGLRYADGAELADELERYLRGEALTALPASPLRRWMLWARRDPLRATRVGVLWLGILALTGVLAVLGLQVASSHEFASRAREAADRGDLLGAAAAYDELRGQRLGSLVPGLADDLERASGFEDPGLIRFLTELKAHPGGAADRGHEELLHYVFSPTGASRRNLARKFLVRELRSEAPLERRLQAARTCAALALVDPLPLLLPGGRWASHDETVLALQAALIDVATTPGSKELALELRRYATSALSGASLDAFDTLIALIADPDPEVARVAHSCTLVLWNRLREEVFTNAGGRLGLVDQAQMRRWAIATWEIARIVQARRLGRGEVVAKQAFRSSRAEDELVGTIGEVSLVWIAWLRAELAEKGVLEEWGLPSDLVAHLSQSEEILRSLKAGLTVEQVLVESPELFRGWPGIALGPDVLDEWNLQRRPGLTWSNLVTDWRKSAYVYVNTWSSPPEEWTAMGTNVAFDPEAVTGHVGVHPDDSIWTDGLVTGVDQGLLRAVQSSDSKSIEFGYPGRSELTVHLHVPTGALAGKVILEHETPDRTSLPWHGTSRIEIAIGEWREAVAQQIPSVTKVTLQVPFTTTTLTRQAIGLPHTMLETRDELTVRIRYLGTEAIYWLRGMTVEFELAGR